jgi:hypothetical protein
MHAPHLSNTQTPKSSLHLRQADALTPEEPWCFLGFLVQPEVAKFRRESAEQNHNSPLRQRVEHHDRLVRPGHHGFRDRDQLILLVQHAQPRRAEPIGIQFRRRPRRKLRPARLEL